MPQDSLLTLATSLAEQAANLEAENARLRADNAYLRADNERLADALWVPPAPPDDEPIPFLPVDPEEQRRLATKASDGEQCMIYRHGA